MTNATTAKHNAPARQAGRGCPEKSLSKLSEIGNEKHNSEKGRSFYTASVADVLGQRPPAALRRAPLREREALHGPEGPGLQAGVAALELKDQVLDLLPPGVAVGGAGILHHRQVQLPGGVGDQLLPAVEQGADLGDPRPVQEGDGLEAGQSPLEDEGQKKSLHRVVVVVAQGDFLDPPFLQCPVEGAPAHFRAHGAGILLLPQVEDDVLDLAF